jgi:sugar lactone lactonase YvrE
MNATSLLLRLSCGGLLCCGPAEAQDYNWRSVTPHDGGPGYADGPREHARFHAPRAAAMGANGIIYVADTGNQVIRRITPDGTVSTLAGRAGMAGYVDGPGAAARFAGPSALEVDAAGNVLVLETGNGALRRISPLGDVTTMVSPSKAGIWQDPVDGPLAEASFSWPAGMAIGPDGSIWVTELEGVVRRISPAGLVSTVAGKFREKAFQDGTGAGARFASPAGIAHEGNGNFLVADTDNYCRRRVTPQGVVTTIPIGRRQAEQVAVDQSHGTIYFTVRYDYDSVFSVLPGGGAAPLTGNWTSTLADCIAPTDPNYASGGLAWDSATGLELTLPYHHSVVRLSEDGEGTIFNACSGEAVYAGSIVTAGEDGALYSSGRGGGHIFTHRNGAVTLLASVDVETRAEFRLFADFVSDGRGGFIVADEYRIGRMAPNGEVTTLAGQWGRNGFADGPGAVARFQRLAALARGADGAIYATEGEAHSIRRLSPDGVVTTLAGVGGIAGSADGRGGSARFRHPRGIAVDAGGTVFVADSGNATIRRIAADGTVTTLAGVAGLKGLRDGRGAEARFNEPRGLALDADGFVYVTDGPGAVRKIAPDGEVRTIAGITGLTGNAEGSEAAALFDDPQGIAVDAAGTVFVADDDRRRLVAGMPSPAPDIHVEDESGAFAGLGGTVKFPTTANGAANSRTLTIRNRGDRDLTGISFRLAGPDAADFSFEASDIPATLAPGDHAEWPVRFQPRLTGEKQAVLLIGSNDSPRNPCDIVLRGMAMEARPVVEVFDLFEGPVGGRQLTSGEGWRVFGVRDFTSNARSFILRNSGSMPLEVSGLSLEGEASAEFSVVSSPPATIAPGEDASPCLAGTVTVTDWST